MLKISLKVGFVLLILAATAYYCYHLKAHNKLKTDCLKERVTLALAPYTKAGSDRHLMIDEHKLQDMVFFAPGDLFWPGDTSGMANTEPYDMDMQLSFVYSPLILTGYDADYVKGFEVDVHFVDPMTKEVIFELEDIRIDLDTNQLLVMDSLMSESFMGVTNSAVKIYDTLTVERRQLKYGSDVDRQIKELYNYYRSDKQPVIHHTIKWVFLYSGPVSIKKPFTDQTFSISRNKLWGSRFQYSGLGPVPPCYEFKDYPLYKVIDYK